MLKSFFYIGNRKRDQLEIPTFFTTSFFLARIFTLSCWFVYLEFFSVDLYDMFRIHQESESADTSLQSIWEWLGQDMLCASVANNFLPGIRQGMALPLYYTESFPKERSGRLGHPHWSCELTAVPYETTERIHPVHTYRCAKACDHWSIIPDFLLIAWWFASNYFQFPVKACHFPLLISDLFFFKFINNYSYLLINLFLYLQKVSISGVWILNKQSILL